MTTLREMTNATAEQMKTKEKLKRQLEYFRLPLTMFDRF